MDKASIQKAGHENCRLEAPRKDVEVQERCPKVPQLGSLKTFAAWLKTWEQLGAVNRKQKAKVINLKRRKDRRASIEDILVYGWINCESNTFSFTSYHITLYLYYINLYYT